MPFHLSPGRRVTLGVHAAVFMAALGQNEIVPLLPRIGHRYGLSAAANALLLAAPGIAMLALCVPIGALSDRLGARRLTLAGGVILCVASFGQALPSYGALIASRLLLGAAFGIVFTSGLVWLARATDAAGSSRLGATVTSASVGSVLGPAIGGLLGQGAGTAAPFLVTGTVAALVATLLFTTPRSVAAPARTPPAPAPPRAGVARAAREPTVLAATAALLISGVVASATQLLAPSELHHAGANAGTIGLIFSAASILYILVSAIVVWRGRRATNVRVNALAAMGAALSLAPGALRVGAIPVVLTLFIATFPRATIGTIAYPLATTRAARVGVGSGIAIGFLNAVWAGGIVVSPLVAGALSQGFGPQGGYIGILAATTAGALALLVYTRRLGLPTARADSAEPTPRVLALASSETI
jgi:MFS family permease